MLASRNLSPTARRSAAGAAKFWRVPRLPCVEIRLRVQFHRDGREIEGEESVSLALIADRGDGDTPIPLAVEPEGMPLPCRNRDSSPTSGSGAGENADRERRGPWTLQRLASSTVVEVPASFPRAASGITPDLGGAPEFVPPRK